MQRSIQFESQHVELWGCYGIERDEDVLEYYDQPTRFPLHYHSNSGRPTTQWHTSDFFVLRRASAGFEEWKHARELEKLAVFKRNRYQRDHTGIWRCPPGESYAEQVGLYYRLRSSAEYHPYYIQNVKTLQDYWAHPMPTDAEGETLVLESLVAYPGVSVAELLRAHPRLPVDLIWAMLSTCRIFTDLEATLLQRGESQACSLGASEHGTECLIVDDAHDLSLEHLMFLKEVTDQGRLQYDHPLGVCLMAAARGDLIPLKEILDQPELTWLQWRRRLDKLEPFFELEPTDQNLLMLSGKEALLSICFKHPEIAHGSD